MTWFDVVKIIGIPKRTMFIPHVVVNREEFENTLRLLRELKEVPKLKGVLDKDKGLGKTHNTYYQQGVAEEFKEVDLSEEESKVLFDEMLEIIAEKQKKYGKQVYSKNKIESLLLEARKAKNNDDKDKVAQIVLEITNNSSKKPAFLRENEVIREQLEALKEYLDSDEGKAHLMFENPPENNNILEQFAELIGGTAKKGKIFIDINSNKDFRELLRPNKEKQQKFLEYREKNDNNPSDEEKKMTARFQFYDKNIKQLKPVFKIGKTSTLIDPRKISAREMKINPKKYELTGNFDEKSVEKYISIVSGLKGSLKKWKPTKFSNATSIATGLLFLERGSSNQNSLVLNPYTSILLYSSLGSNWYKSFFDELRTNEILTDVDVDRMIIDDISEALMNRQDKSSLGVSVVSFSRLPKIRNLLTAGRNKGKVNEELRKIIKDNQDEGEIGSLINEEKRNIRREQLSLLEKYFTIKEGKTILDKLKETGQDEDIDVDYYNLRGVKIEERLDTEAVYMGFSEFGETILPENINEYVDNLSVSRDTSGASKRALETALKEVEEKIKNPKSDKLKESYQSDINRLKQKLSELGESPQSDSKELEIDSIRQAFLRPTDFVSLVQAIGSKESLNSLISKNSLSLSLSDLIDPKNTLTYFSLLAERLSNDEIAEAFNKIDSDPTTTDAENILNALNDKMPNLLRTYKKEVIDAFKNQLQLFVDNYAETFSSIQIKPAIDGFINKNLITEVTT